MEDETFNKAEEPAAEYANKQILFFKSFEESELYSLKQMALHTYEQRLSNLEKLRKRFLAQGENLKPLARIITIIKGTVK